MISVAAAVSDRTERGAHQWHLDPMNAELFGFSFATRTTESFGVESAVQEAREGVVEKRNTRRASTERMRPAKLTAAATAQLTASGLLEVVEPSHYAADLVISSTNYRILTEVTQEIRRGDDLRRHGLEPRSKLLFCGPPGCGKTLCAEVIASELKLPLLVARLDAVITTYLGETASNLRRVFDAAAATPVVLFFDEFDALARARTDASEHSEIRRVVNSLLMMIDRFKGKGLLIAATNLEQTIDLAAWRRFDEVLLFERPTETQIRSLLKIKFRNFPANFEPSSYANKLMGLSYAEIERVSLSAIKRAILIHEKSVSESLFEQAIDSERRRASLRETRSA